MTYFFLIPEWSAIYATDGIKTEKLCFQGKM